MTNFNYFQEYSLIKRVGLSHRRDFLRMMGIIPGKRLFDIKTFESAVEKCIRKNAAMADLSDIVRGAVLVPRRVNLTKAVKRFVHQYRKFIVDVEYKDGSASSYRGSWHIHLRMQFEIPINFELQVMPATLWVYKEEAHKIYEKQRASSVKSAELAAMARLFDIALKIDAAKRQLKKQRLISSKMEDIL